jgi:hypothetical protein
MIRWMSQVDLPEVVGTQGLWQTRLLDGEAQKIWTVKMYMSTQSSKYLSVFYIIHPIPNLTSLLRGALPCKTLSTCSTIIITLV